jgi:hypothetical protein
MRRRRKVALKLNNHALTRAATKMPTRTTLLSGPATATYAGHTFVARDGILVRPALELEAVDSDAQGILDATATLQPVTIKFMPQAPFADLIALYPFLDGAPGTPLFGASDTPLVLVAANGARLTFSAVAITQMPDLSLGASGPIAGAVTFLALGARELPVTAANRLVMIDATDAPVFPAVTPQLTDDFEITWGDAPWLNLRARDGVAVKFAMKTRPVMSAANALLDLTLESLAVTASFTPAVGSIPATPSGPAEADLVAALQMQGTLPGRLLSQGANALTIAGEHLWMQMPLAQMTAGAMAFDATHLRVGELVFTATRVLLSAEAVLGEMASLSEGQS